MFKNTGTAVTSKTNDTFKQVINSVTEHVFPKLACQKLKSYMRRFLKKPRDLTAKKFIEHVIHINKLLERFPDPSSTTTAAKMPKDNILDLLEANMPHAWERHMHLQGFKPLKSTINDVFEFCEQLELAKDVPVKKGTRNSTNKESQGKSKHACTNESKKQGRSKDNSEDKFHCMLHGPNPTHDTKNCRNL